jgi:predicted nucleic acid-binding protein
MTAVDTNVLVALLKGDEAFSILAEQALNRALENGRIAISAPVWSELRAFPSRDEAMLDEFLSLKEVQVDWVLGEAVWRLAGKSFQEFNLLRRRNDALEAPRRMLTDFVIGAHAVVNGYTLATLDQRHYRAAFPRLPLISF